ncbi:B12-binding domain-containing radical SAM protein [Streptomyces sp. YS-B37]|uniref:B12-binding domain-containing radical SAM protein n=1 Tax=Streptomyces sp. YS-B37 TaxID=3407669 RepID=UPI003B5148D7
MGQSTALSVLLLNLFSKKYPAIGESHGLSVVAGALQKSSVGKRAKISVLDMVALGEEGPESAIRLIEEQQINVLAIGLPYGTYGVLSQSFKKLRAALQGEKPLVVFGGALATYLGSRILKDVAPEAFVIRGEAEVALPGLVEAWSAGNDPRSIPNILYADPETGQETSTPRRLVNLDNHGLPYRLHIPDIQRVGGQVFMESSRGCSWSACTFCLRGLTDVRGKGSEYRRKNTSLLAQDVAALLELGVSQITFADEDFLGSSVSEAERFVSDLEACMPGGSVEFGASCTVQSVYSRKDDEETGERRKQLLQRLTGIGLRRVFLGVESCSRSQLKRYAKGHTPEESVAAMRRLQELGIRVEVGVILLDPLCTLEEVQENLMFMMAHGMLQLASGLSNELRLQTSSSYMKMVRRYQDEKRLELITGDMDPDTLSFPYQFADGRVTDLCRRISYWSRKIHPIYYPAKSLTRFGKNGVLGDLEAGARLRSGIEEFRLEYARATVEAIRVLRGGTNPDPVLRERITPALLVLARQLQAALLSAEDSVRGHPVVTQALTETGELLDSYKENMMNMRSVHHEH